LLTRFAAAVIGDYIYFDGGFVVKFNDTDTSDQGKHPNRNSFCSAQLTIRLAVTYPMNQTLSISLAESWSADTVTINQNDPGSRPFTYLPALWPTHGGFYSFGGTQQLNSTTNNGLWEFLADGNGGGAWARHPDPHGAVTYGVNSATCTSANNVGYCYGGYNYDYRVVTHGNTTSYPLEFSLSPGVVSYDMSSGDWANSTAQEPGYTVSNAMSRVIPDLGSSGLLLSFGGAQIKGYSLADSGIYLNQEPVAMDTISVFDIESETWYEQATTGLTPPQRIGACTTLVKSPSGTYEL
jgi:hypothetical protein